MLEKLTDNTIDTQRKWLKFLLERVGHNNLPRLIDYYKSIGWISESAGRGLLALAGQEKRYKSTSWTLSAEEHRISRHYIEKLEGKQIDESVLNVVPPGKAVPVSLKKIEIRPADRIQPLHPVEKKKLEFEVHRREVAIDNLEQALEEKDEEINKLKKMMQELELQLDECQKEIKKNKIFVDLLDQNARLRKAERVNRKAEWEKVT